MIQKIRNVKWAAPIVIGGCLFALFTLSPSVGAITAIPDPAPEPGSYGIEATKTQPAPTQAATITTPGGGASFTTSPTTVSGICPTDLLIQVYDNNVMVGSVMCTGGSFSLQITLFAGTNDLSVIDYDDLGQAGPASGTTTVTYTNAQFTAFGELITLTSSYGRRSTAAGSELDWPLELSGGTGPYAFSIDWGDGSTADLKSQSLAGLVTIAHTFKTAGIYQLNVKVTDTNGVSAFLQVIGLASGKPAATPTTTTASKNTTTILWIPAVVAVILIGPAYWLGRRSQVISLRNKMLKERDSVENE